MPAKKLATATCIDGQALYDVTYHQRADMDSKVPYSYLRELANKGWEVHVGAKHDTAAHVIPAGGE